ncbi:MAG: hypothetical protein M3Y87_10365 [Myxococcota bacterium]|nr:hypothetical protein [Myxococcota bacterium]
MSATKYRVERRAGRLIEAKVFGLRTREDADEYGAAIIAAVRAHPGKEAPVLCADHREVVIYPQPAADRLVELFRPNNSRFERIAILVAATNVTITMQLDRLTREAGFRARSRISRRGSTRPSSRAPAPSSPGAGERARSDA